MAAITPSSKTYATGRRKTAVARVYLVPGSGQIIVNGRDDEEYFGRPTCSMVVRQPFEEVELLGKYDVDARVNGGGVNSQAGAVRHGITRALMLIDGGLRSKLKSAGYVTRDPRKKERKKYGQRAARARFQFSKR